MPLIKAFLLPHSPLLIPEIGRANHEFLAKTSAAYQKAKTEFEAAGIDTIIVISPHNRIRDNFFIINAAPEMEISFSDFGFIPPKNFVKGDVILSDKIKNVLKNELPIRSLSDNQLDYGSGIPLYLLKNQNSNFKVLVVSPADGLDLKENFDFGVKLREIIGTENKKIAVVVSGDLSHRLKRKSPAGYSPKGAKFDNKLIEYLSDPDNANANILNMDKRLIAEASECGLKPLVILLGILGSEAWEPDILAYQTDFGIGYLSLEFLLAGERPQND